MLIGGATGGLEVRAEGDGGARLSGRFPYNSVAVLSDGGRTGRPRKEKFAPRAFEYRVKDPQAEIHLLAGHSFDRPLASKLTGSLDLTDSDDALTFEARIAPAIAQTSYARDVLALVSAGLAVGISPGFRLPPERAVAKPETIEQEPDKPEEGMHAAIIRTVNQALLFELSIVTRPAFPESQVEARSWDVASTPSPSWHSTMRWR